MSPTATTRAGRRAAATVGAGTGLGCLGYRAARAAACGAAGQSDLARRARSGERAAGAYLLAQ